MAADIRHLMGLPESAEPNDGRARGRRIAWAIAEAMVDPVRPALATLDRAEQMPGADVQEILSRLHDDVRQATAAALIALHRLGIE